MSFIGQEDEQHRGDILAVGMIVVLLFVLVHQFRTLPSTSYDVGTKEVDRLFAV